jgi:hypothetical protein
MLECVRTRSHRVREPLPGCDQDRRLVDRRFNRARYNAEAMVAAFSVPLRQALDHKTINDELLQVVEQALAPAHASTWIKPNR